MTSEKIIKELIDILKRNNLPKYLLFPKHCIWVSNVFYYDFQKWLQQNKNFKNIYSFIDEIQIHDYFYEYINEIKIIWFIFS